MNRIANLRSSFGPLATLMAFFSTLTLSSCSRRNDAGSYTMWGALVLILDVVAMIDALRQPWSLGKKLLWIAIIYLLPVLGLILYYLISGRGKS
ncbi:PLD nuclease N-terminal domain-containing protein [Hymenobacter sp. CRA2]|uniref:PLD nuclease N-terminal domain-containing protein n=1 Tax=Hymenobacter sp. CRA2 TaxID=1955620 RepID=UPI001C37B969|nr:PLD nuclease N-terminal domain-containing protein [Hymenobacter sp. CRA2]